MEIRLLHSRLIEISVQSHREFDATWFVSFLAQFTNYPVKVIFSTGRLEMTVTLTLTLLANLCLTHFPSCQTSLPVPLFGAAGCAPIQVYPCLMSE